VDALDHTGAPVTLSAEGWPARILQHEIDHLRGVLCIDRMKSRTFATGRNYGHYTGDMTIAEVLAAVGETGAPDAPLGGPEET
jgi:peptide deformylase